MIAMDFGAGTTSFAINKDGDVISIDSEEVISAKDYTGLGEDVIRIMTSGSPGILEQEEAFYAFAPVHNVGWTLCARVPRSVLMEKAERFDASFRTAVLAFLVISAVLILAAVYFSNLVSKSITQPVDLLLKDIRIISDGDLEHRAAAFRNDEIGDVSKGLNEMVIRLKGTMNDLVNAQDNAERMRELANKDALTGVRNKTAYDRFLRQIEKDLGRGEERFGFAMIDINGLKQINDSFGHEKGDIAIRKLSGIVCSVFEHSPVFRIGGDEFVVILMDSAYGEREKLVAEFRRRISEISETPGLEPWERVSAAIGCAVYDSRQDRTAGDVFARADAEMYESKKSMKEA